MGKQLNELDDEWDDESFEKKRRSSLRVNLSFLSNVSDSGVSSKAHESTEAETSEQNGTVINFIRKETDLNHSCTKLKDAIINKTKEIFNEPNDITKKMSEVLRQEIDIRSGNNQSGTESHVSPNEKNIVVTPKSSRRIRRRGSLDKSHLSQRRLFLDNSMGEEIQLELSDSPIISQGSRSKLSRLSLRRSNSSSVEDKESSLNETGVNISGVPITCSTFLESPDKNKTIDVDGSGSTINLEDTGGSSSRSCMEITTVINTVPIMSRSDLKKSRAENMNEEKQLDDSSPFRCSPSTVRSSLAVNTSLDPVDNLEVPKTSNFRVSIATTVRSSLRVNTSLDSVRKSPKRTSVSTVRSSLQMNTSLDSLRRSPVKNTIDYKKLCTMIEETEKNETSIESVELENVSLMERVRINLENHQKSDTNRMSKESTGTPGIVDPTPYPTSRSVLYKTQIIKNNTHCTSKKLFNDDSEVATSSSVQQSDLSDTIIVESSLDTTSVGLKSTDPIIINESLNDTRKSISERKTQKVNKRKLFVVGQDSELFSMTPVEEPPSSPTKTKPIKPKTKKSVKEKKTQKEPEPTIDVDPQLEASSNDVSMLALELETPKKKPRKIVSKKIVVKKTVNAMQKLCEEMDKEPERLSERSSINEFVLKKTTKENVPRKNSKTVIATTGLSNGDKELVKNAAKTLGKVVIENIVTSRTTHVVSTGVRTINLLRGIIRGCWLVSLEWIQRSLESETWLDPAPFEMLHFSKAVQENRRDRQLFGKAYVPELFATCGLVFVENGTSPPPAILKELIKTAGGQTTENPYKAKIIVGPDGFKELWVLDSITTGELQSIEQYKWKSKKC